MLGSVVTKFIGTKNDKRIKSLSKKIESIKELEKKYSSLSDESLKEHFSSLRDNVLLGKKTKDEVLQDSFAITKEVSKRVIGLIHFDVQLIGGMVLYDGSIAQMSTGEGKTLAATLPAVLHAMDKKGVHIVTVNDYLAKRDADDMGKIYDFLGYSVGAVTSNLLDNAQRKAQYEADITYGTNNEFGFDYLRDNMKHSIQDRVQRGHGFAIVDEIDSILIDEARTPLVISGSTDKKFENYNRADSVASKLRLDKDFSIDEKNRTVLVTEEGVERAEKLFGVDNLYNLENAILSHHLDQALKARYIFKKDVDYIVKDGEILIVDEFTGRVSIGRRFSEGLHQALEAKERVSIKEESQTLASITFQNYFRQYDKLSGMTGTAQTEASEFAKIYNLDVVSIPTNVPCIRKDYNDLIFKSQKDKFEAIVKKIKELYNREQPVLVGTASIEKSDLIHNLLKKDKIPHSVLNAKHHEEEANIIKNAGLKKSVTIATNMAGRGVDIKLGEGVKELGGLFVLGTERHDNRRIDNQLRGRAGRQGDSGMSQFYLSLEDNLLRIFGGDRVKLIMNKLGMKEGEPIESKMITKAVENAQKKVESYYFEARKNLLEFDDVLNEQRKIIYKFREEVLDFKFNFKSKIDENMDLYISSILQKSDIHEYSFYDKENIDIQKLGAILQEDISKEASKIDIKDISYSELFSKIKEIAKMELKNKTKLLDDVKREQIARFVFLQVLDECWRDHLYQVDTLKTGIGLRGYNQKDPLVEYKKDSYSLFLELVNRIKIETIKTLLLIKIQTKEEKDRLDKIGNMFKEFSEDSTENISLEHKSSIYPDNKKNIGYSNTVVNATKKISRNAPCYCGSGKKYKYCHGRSGPKKGMISRF